MIVREMDNRGSKSEFKINYFFSNYVKEQRVDGTGYLYRVFKVYSSGLEKGTIIM